MTKRFLLIFTLVVLAFWSCEKDEKEEEEEYIIPDLEEYVEDNFPGAQPTESCVYIIVTSEGTGPKPEDGDQLYSYYVLTLLTGDTIQALERQEDPEADPTAPFSFYLNSTSVIKGWSKGFAELNRGSKATILIPDSLAYGDSKVGKIPPNSPLRYDVELLYLQGDEAE